jgi:hypothetical protein
MIFTVIDKKTGAEPDLRSIAQEDWADNLVYCDIDGFYIDSYGTLILADECGNHAICPDDRFIVIYTNLLFEDGGTECKH